MIFEQKPLPSEPGVAFEQQPLHRTKDGLPNAAPLPSGAIGADLPHPVNLYQDRLAKSSILQYGCFSVTKNIQESKRHLEAEPTAPGD
jgi:hypothetical protein